MMNLRIFKQPSAFLTRYLHSTRNTSIRFGEPEVVRNWTPFFLRFNLSPRTFSTSTLAQAGHSHWQNIKHTKGANDLKRAAIATRVARDMRVAIKLHGSANPKDNNELAKIIQYAKSENLPGETIERTLASCMAAKNKTLETITLECKGPAGSLMILELSSANVNKTKQDIRSIFKKRVASIVDGGGVFHHFEQKSIVTAKNSEKNSEKNLEKNLEKNNFDSKKNSDSGFDLEKEEEIAIEIGAEEVSPGDFPGEVVFVCDPMEASKMVKALEKLNYTIIENVTEYIPKNIVELPQEALDELNNLKAKLEEHPDFSNIYFNCVT